MNEPLYTVCECCGNKEPTMRYSVIKMLGIELRYYFRLDQDWHGELNKMMKEYKLTNEEYMEVLKEGLQ